jgi:transposase-like protein
MCGNGRGALWKILRCSVSGRAAGEQPEGRKKLPKRRIQKSIVHMVRNPVKFVSYKDLKAVCAGLKAIYRAPGEDSGRAVPETFGEKWQANTR